MSAPALPFAAAFYAALLGLLALVLAGLVIRQRVKNGIGIGDQDHPEMIRAMRVHANFSEYVPLALILIALGEIVGVSHIVVHALGIALLIGRLLHAYGLSRSAKSSPGRFVGTVLTFLVLLVASLLLLARVLPRIL